MSKPQTYESSVLVDTPPSRVWQVWTDVEHWPEWSDSVTSVEPLDDGPLQVGSRLRIAQPGLPTTVWTVTELVEETRFVWHSSSPGVSTVATHEVTGEGTGSRVTARIEQGGPLSRLARALKGRLVERYLALESAGLKARSEG